MSNSSKNILRAFYRWLRRGLSPPLRELSRTGKITQTLLDAAQLQSQQRRLYQQAGEFAISLVKEGKLQSIGIERVMAKLDQIERLLKRQELLLKSYQRRGDIREVLKEDRAQNQNSLEPI